MCNNQHQCLEYTYRQKEWDCGMLEQGGEMIVLTHWETPQTQSKTVLSIILI